MKKKEGFFTSALIPTDLTKENIKASLIIYRYMGVAVASLILSVFLLIALVYLALKPKTEIPYVVEITTDGDVRYVKDAVTTLSSWTPSQSTTMHVLRDYIINLRGVSSDRSVQVERIKKVYAFSTGDATKTINEYLEETSPVERLERETVRIDVYAITPLINGNEKIYQLDWNEKTYSLSGTLKNEKNYRGVLYIEYYLPRTKNLQEVNPLGIYVNNIEISEIKDGYVVL